MADDQDVLQQINDLGGTPWSGVAFRHTAPHRDPLSGVGALRYGGRWNPPDLVSTIYLASPVATCIAEFLRMVEGQGKGPESFLPREIHELAITDLDVLDLTAAGALSAVGLGMSDIQSADRSICQRVGELAHYLGLQGVHAPSASGAGVVLAAFEPTIRPNQLRLVTTRQMSSYL